MDVNLRSTSLTSLIRSEADGCKCCYPLITPARPKRKPYVIRANVDIYYEIDPNTLPDWVDDLGVEKLAAAAFTNHNKALTLTGLAEVLNQNPAEISLNSVLIS